MGVPPVKKWAAPISFFTPLSPTFWFSGKFLGRDYAILPNRK